MKKLIVLLAFGASVCLANNECYNTLNSLATRDVNHYRYKLNFEQGFKLGICYADAKYDYCFNGGDTAAAIRYLNDCIDKTILPTIR